VDAISERDTPVARIDHGWIRGGLLNHTVELVMLGECLHGVIQQIARNGILVELFDPDAAVNMPQFATDGTAVISMETGAVRVPVTIRPDQNLLWVEFIGLAERIERRQHVRVAVNLPVQLRWIAADGVATRAEAHTRDLSVAAVRIAAIPAAAAVLDLIPGGHLMPLAWPGPGCTVLVTITLPTGVVQCSASAMDVTWDDDLRLKFIGTGPLTVPEILALVSVLIPGTTTNVRTTAARH